MGYGIIRIMKINKEKVLNYSLIAILGISLLIFLYLRFSNPDMSDARFFIEYWEFHLSILVVPIIIAIRSLKK